MKVAKVRHFRVHKIPAILLLSCKLLTHLRSIWLLLRVRRYRATGARTTMVCPLRFMLVAASALVALAWVLHRSYWAKEVDEDELLEQEPLQHGQGKSKVSSFKYRCTHSEAR